MPAYLLLSPLVVSRRGDLWRAPSGLITGQETDGAGHLVALCVCVACRVLKGTALQGSRWGGAANIRLRAHSRADCSFYDVVW